MNNYTTEVYQSKRSLINFSNKISKGVSKPVQKLCQDMVYGITSSRSSYLSDIARSLKENNKRKNTIDRLSHNLMYLDEDEKQIMETNHDKELMSYLKDGYVAVLNDNSDINKEYSNKLEDLCTVRDASSKQEKYVNGYMVCEYVALTEKTQTPVSLYSKIYSTTSDSFMSENDETMKGEDIVNKKLKGTCKIPIYVRDRGYDANEIFKKDIDEDNKFVTRLEGNRYLLFKDKKKIVTDAVKNRKGKIVTKLMYHGENKECYISYTKVKLPVRKNKELTLVTIHGLSSDGIPMMLLTNLVVNCKEDAEYIVRLYFLRWRIEEYFKAKKQEFKWEDSLLRTLKSMNNYNFFLTLVMTNLTILIEKIEENFLSNLILEHSKSLKEKALVYFGMMSKGLYEILKNAKEGIRIWQKIETREKIRQLRFSI